MTWDVEFTDEFSAWWEGLSPEEQESVDFGVGLLIERGPTLPFPYSSQVKGSKFGEMRELRVQHQAGHTGSCMRSTRCASRCYSWAATRPEIKTGTTARCP